MHVKRQHLTVGGLRRLSGLAVTIKGAYCSAVHDSFFRFLAMHGGCELCLPVVALLDCVRSPCSLLMLLAVVRPT